VLLLLVQALLPEYMQSTQQNGVRVRDIFDRYASVLVEHCTKDSAILEGVHHEIIERLVFSTRSFYEMAKIAVDTTEDSCRHRATFPLQICRMAISPRK
jgi:hypothetical protein